MKILEALKKPVVMLGGAETFQQNLVQDIKQQLAVDPWLQLLIRTSNKEFPLVDSEIFTLVRHSYEYIAPILCKLVSQVEQEFPSRIKVCPFRSGQLYQQVADTLLPRSKASTWTCFDYPSALRTRISHGFLGTNEFMYWEKDREFKSLVLQPTKIILVDWGCNGSVINAFNILRARYEKGLRNSDLASRTLSARFLFSTAEAVQAHQELTGMILLPDDPDLNEEELEKRLQADPQLIGKLNLAQITHDCCRGIYAPRQLAEQIRDVRVEVGVRPNRPKHPNPWVYARNTVINQSVLAYANKHRRNWEEVAYQQFEVNSLNWAGDLTPDEYSLFSLSRWKDEIIPIKEE